MDLKELNVQCEAAIEHFKKEMVKLRTGRVQTNILDAIQVEYYGSQAPLKQLALVNSPEPRLLTVQPYDASAIAAIEKAIQSCDLGLNPSRDGNILRVWIPPLTEDRRKEAVKALHKLAEESRIGVRSGRKEAIDSLKNAHKKKTISEDDLHRGQDQIQKVVDDSVKKIDALMAVKEKELMEV